MRLTKLIVSNFRSLDRIEFQISNRVAVIVGPNAVGKTTILEAIRLLKSFLIPRSFDETQNVLTSLSAMSQHMPFGQINLASLARNVGKPVEISATFQFSDSDIQAAEKNLHQLAILHVRHTKGIGPTQGDTALVQFLSSKDGQQARADAESFAKNGLDSLKPIKEKTLRLTIDPEKGVGFGDDIFAQEVISVVEQSLPPSQSLFSYFPADRALPAGEAAIQIGSADAHAQLQAHLSVPSTKYARLKQMIVNGFIHRNPKEVANEFETIFEKLLVGRELAGMGTSPIGLFNVLVRDKASQKVFDIDGMSSGEKGLILLFLLLKRSLAPGGIALIDEPELHLNPAICKKLLPFILEEIVDKCGIQLLICSHSPELLSAAFGSDQCDLFHLRSEKDISRVMRHDREEVSEALKRLGASTSDVLFSKGNIYVEGDHDIELLDEGFSGRLFSFKITSVGGRTEIEKEIGTLQDGERSGKVNTLQIFVLDQDRSATSVANTQLVRVLQWDRYCIENFLIEEDVLYDFCKASAKAKPESRGIFSAALKEVALAQKTRVVAASIYGALEPENAGFRPKEIGDSDSFDIISQKLADRLEKLAGQLREFDRERWASDFIDKCDAQRKAVEATWEKDWNKLCDGKRFFSDFHRRFQISMSLLETKKRIMRQMRVQQSDGWKLIDSQLSRVLN